MWSHRPIRAVAIALVVLASSTRARAGDTRVTALAKQDAAARQRCADDLVKLARSLAELKAFDDAREELRRAMLHYQRVFGAMLGDRELVASH